MIKHERIRVLKEGGAKKGPVIYWMSRDQRAGHNWALLHAREIAIRSKAALGVAFTLAPEFLDAGIRQYGFMLRGLEETEEQLKTRRIPFFLLEGPPEVVLPEFVRKNGISTLVTDFDPLRIKKDWKKKVARQIDIPFHEVDAHNIIPCWHASPKQEYAAYTFRPKVRRMLDEFLEPIPPLRTHPWGWTQRTPTTDWKKVRRNLNVNTAIPEIDWLVPGEKSGAKISRHFIKHKLSAYDTGRNDPNRDALSNISPYLHFGQISAQQFAFDVRRAGALGPHRDAFLEELIVRRELADNYCHHNPNYDRFPGFPEWARKTLDEHRKDRREYLYSHEQFERGKTHDALWNAAQKQMVRTGKMHGYMRMYWAKKLLEWTESPEQAQKIAIALNDAYELDGRDPNGYTGIAWSIGGVHDRAWFDRPIFGKVRFMSASGARSKFDVDAYISKMEGF